MAQEDKGSGGNLPVAGIVALVLFASGLWVQHQPLQSDRPGVELKQDKERSIYQDVEARLWQDPLEAVKRAETADEKGTDAATPQGAYEAERREPESLRNWIARDKNRQRLVMPVMVFGGPYAEDAEQRRRTRYAVLSGLREAGYAPDNSRSLGYIRLQPDEKESQKMLIPFEKWGKNKSEKTHWEEVYVLWLSEESLGLQPVQRLGEALDQIVPRKDPKVEITVLGPASYRMATHLATQVAALSAMETARVGADERFELTIQGHPVRFISPHLSYPTATLARQIARDTRTDAEQKQEREALSRILEQPMKSLRLGPDDRQLARLLIEELANRGLKLPTEAMPVCDDQVALVVEADTHYARSLKREFSSLLKACRSSFRPMVFHYFRGLDGKVAQDSSDTRKTSDSGRDKSRQESTPSQERALGQGQFDYLRRIADEIRRRSDAQQREVQERDEEAREQNGNGQSSTAPDQRPSPQRGAVRAVIVLGSDIHDKLVILHALRESLPHTLFATTDLDAGLLQKEQLPWTRNVIVASGYDLKLPPALQKSAPPFRDTFQTASYLATRKALAHPERDANAELKAQIGQVSRQVKLFEIGNRSAEGLSFVQQDPPGPAAEQRGAGNGAAQPWGLLTKVVAMMAVFGLAISWCLRQLMVDLWQRRPYAIGTVAATAASGVYLVSVIWMIGHISAQAGEEPLSWLGGVSVWPGALIRNAAGLLAVVLFLHSVDRLRKGEKAIDEEFFKAETDHASQEQALQRKSARWFQETWFPSANGEEHASRNRAHEVWQEYKNWTRAPRCCVRVALGVLAIMGLVVVMLMELGMPTAPVRGPASTRLYLAMVGPSFFLMIVMLVWTLDRVALCSLFLRRLYGSQGVPKRSGWSADVQQKFCGYCTAAPDQTAGAAAQIDDEDAAQSYIDLRLSARISRHVGGIIVYPFILALLLIVSRARYLDNWDMTPGFLGIILMILLLMTLGAYTLRQNAERIRRYTIEQLEALEVRLQAKNYETKTQTTSEQVALMKTIAVNLSEGAFAPFASQPIVRAILLPFGGAGLINLLDYVLV